MVMAGVTGLRHPYGRKKRGFPPFIRYLPGMGPEAWRGPVTPVKRRSGWFQPFICYEVIG
jgi:hypothetical protein